MKKKLALVLGVLLLLSLVLSGCDILAGLFSTITVQVTNDSGWIIEVSYREAGDTAWTKVVTVYSTDNVETFDLPSPGTYDFKVVDWVSQGTYVSSIFSDEDCSLEIGEIDYYMRVRLGDSVSFY